MDPPRIQRARRLLDVAGRRGADDAHSPRRGRSGPQYLDPLVECPRHPVHRGVVERTDDVATDRCDGALGASGRVERGGNATAMGGFQSDRGLQRLLPAHLRAVWILCVPSGATADRLRVRGDLCGACVRVLTVPRRPTLAHPGPLLSVDAARAPWSTRLSGNGRQAVAGRLRCSRG